MGTNEAPYVSPGGTLVCDGWKPRNLQTIALHVTNKPERKEVVAIEQDVRDNYRSGAPVWTRYDVKLDTPAGRIEFCVRTKEDAIKLAELLYTSELTSIYAAPEDY